MNYLTERRAEILDAAGTVAAESGIDAMTMDQVARKTATSAPA